MKISVLIILFSVATQILFAQTQLYDIYHDEEIIGEIIAKKTISDSTTKYSIKSVSEFKIFWTYIITSKLLAEYNSGEMISCSSTQSTNEEMKDQSALEKKGDFYVGFKYPDTKFNLKNSIKFSSARLYYEEPLDVDSVFSESYLQHCKLEQVGKNRYQLYMPDGNHNFYTYKNGKLQNILVERTLFDLRFVAKE